MYNKAGTKTSISDLIGKRSTVSYLLCYTRSKSLCTEILIRLLARSVMTQSRVCIMYNIANIATSYGWEGLGGGSRYVQISYENLENFQQVKRKT